MRFEQTRDVIEHARAFHRKVGEFYEKLADRAEQKRVKLLLDYMSRHEKNLEEALEDYEKGASTKVLDTWFDFTYDQDLLRPCEDTQLQPDMSVDDVVAVAMKLDSCLIQLYKEMAQCAECGDVSEVFRSLLDMEEREQHRLARNALRAMDF